MPAGGGDDAHRDGLADVEGIADGENDVADAEFGTVGEGGGGEILGLDFDDRDVGLGIGANNLGNEFPLIIEQHLQFIRLLDDMVVGDNKPVGRDNDTGAEAALFLLAALQTILAEKLRDLLAHDLA